MSKGLGKRQRDILAKLAEHRDNPPDYNGRWYTHIRTGERMYRAVPESRRDRYPEWMTVAELAGRTRERELARIVRPLVSRWRGELSTRLLREYSSGVESTRRAVRKLEAAGLVETRWISRNNVGQRQLGVRLRLGDDV
jgi:hypothetical protein